MLKEFYKQTKTLSLKLSINRIKLNYNMKKIYKQTKKIVEI